MLGLREYKKNERKLFIKGVEFPEGTIPSYYRTFLISILSDFCIGSTAAPANSECNKL